MAGPPQAPPAAGNAKRRLGWEHEGKNEVDRVEEKYLTKALSSDRLLRTSEEVNHLAEAGWKF